MSLGNPKSFNILIPKRYQQTTNPLQTYEWKGFIKILDRIYAKTEHAWFLFNIDGASHKPVTALSMNLLIAMPANCVIRCT